MQHRIFIAINLPEDIKNELFEYQYKFPELPIRWTKRYNLHITSIFIGNVNDDEILEICKTTGEVAVKTKSFALSLDKILYAPPKKIPPRMVWAEGKKSKELALLKDNLEKALLNSKGMNFSTEARAFSPHITLGRIKTWEWKNIEPEERPEVKEDIDLNFQVDSIEVMESQLKKSGAEYAILESFQLKE